MNDAAFDAAEHAVRAALAPHPAASQPAEAAEAAAEREYAAFQPRAPPPPRVPDPPEPPTAEDPEEPGASPLLDRACVRAYLAFADLALAQLRPVAPPRGAPAGLPAQCVQLAPTTDVRAARAALRQAGEALLALDATLPRGGAAAEASAALTAAVADALARSRRVCAVRLHGFAALPPRLLGALAGAAGLADLAVTDTDAFRSTTLATLAPARLVRLDVRGTPFDGAGLARFPLLAELCVARCDALCPEHFYRSVAALPHLAALDLSDTRAPLTPVALAALLAEKTRLRRLALAGCPALAVPTLLRVDPAAHLRALAVLDIARCHAAPADAAALVATWLPAAAVRVLNVADCTGLAPAPLARLTRAHGGGLDRVLGLETLSPFTGSSSSSAIAACGGAACGAACGEGDAAGEGGDDDCSDDDDYLPC